MTKYLVPVGFFAAMMGLLWYGLSLKPSELPSTKIGKDLPAMALPTLASPQSLTTEKVFEGKVSLFNIWATWCLSCRKEHKSLEDISHQYSINMVGLAYQDKVEDVKHWLKEQGNPYDTLFFDVNGRYGMELGVYGTPETFIVDHKGRVRYKHVGPIDMTVWQETLWPFIQELEREAV